jgi:hypothetical protein
MATKKRRLTAQQAYNQGRLPTRTSTGDTRSVTPLRRGAQAPTTFRPVKTQAYNIRKAPGSPAGNPSYWNTRPGYRQQSGRFPNAPQMPVEFDPNADTNTVQGAINAGLMAWNPSLAGLGYTAPPRAPSMIGIPGYNPDLGAAVAGDWELAAAMGDIEAANAADEAAARENINALAVNWGGDLSDLLSQGLIDRGAYDAAKANQFSQMAELGHQLSQGQGQLQARLAARGILSSGALPGGEAELNRQYQRETTTGLQELMGQIRGIRSSQAQARAQRQADLAGVRANVAQRLSQLEAYQPIPAQQAFWDNATQSYVDDWGRRFDRQGRRLS